MKITLITLPALLAAAILLILMQGARQKELERLTRTLEEVEEQVESALAAAEADAAVIRASLTNAEALLFAATNKPAVTNPPPDNSYLLVYAGRTTNGPILRHRVITGQVTRSNILERFPTNAVILNIIKLEE